MTLVGKTLISLGLQDQPSLESLEAAYRELKRTNNLPENPEVRRAKEQHAAIANATSVDEVRRLAGGDATSGYDDDFRR